MARIVLISPYLKGGQNAAKLAQRTRYVATRPGVELLADEKSELPATKKQQDFIARLLKSFPTSRELVEYEDYRERPTQGNASAFIQQTWENYAEAMDQKENFVDYISHRPGVQKSGEHGLWDADGKVQNLAQAVREVAEHTGNVWTPVVALRREDAERLGYDSAENWQALVNASICDIAKAYKIQPDNLRWYAAFHQKPNQVHIHMIIFSADPKEGYLTKEGIREMKSVFARRIYHADRMHIYQQKDTARQELQAQTRRAMVECIVQLEHGVVDNPRLEQLTEELAERLLTIKGRKVYGYLPPRVKAIVDAIVEELAKDERVSAAYETWQTLYEQVCLDYDQRPPKRLPLSQQKEFRTVRNMVIQETLQWMAERQRYAEVRRTPSAQEGPIKGGDKHDCLPPPDLCRYYFFVSSSASLQSRMYLAASSALIPAKNVLTQDGTSPFGTTPIKASTLISRERAKCATVSSFGLVFPRSKSEMLRSVVPSFSASSTCVRPSSCRALFRATPKRLQISCIPSPFLLFSF